MTLAALAYASSATRPLSDAELEDLLARARRANQQFDVTGVLLYDDGSFLQYVEGPPHGVAAVYERVRRSPLHGGIIELIRGPIPSRIFSDWQMGFTRTPASGLLRLSNASWKAQLKRGAASPVLTDSEGFQLLLQFWNSRHPEVVR